MSGTICLHLGVQDLYKNMDHEDKTNAILNLAH